MAYDGWGKARAGFVAFIFLVTLGLPFVVSSDHVADQAEREVTPSLALPPATSHQKQKIDWNKHHYNWKDFEDNGSVRVIIAIDDEQFKSLSKSLQNKLSKAKDYTYSFAFVGISARLDSQTLDSILQENPSIQIQPDFPVNATVATTQTGANVMWNRTDDWGYNVNGHNTTIAIIDTGINYNHPDLGGGFGPAYKVIGGYDYVHKDSDPMDDNGHGTHCAGIAAANGTIKGMAPDAKLYAYKVLGSTGTGSMSNVIKAIEQSEDPNDDGNTSDHVDVISLSLGGSGSQDDASCLAVKEAVAVGIVVVIAAGNDGPTMRTIESPGMAVEAITVGAVWSTGELADWSSRGPAPDLTIKPELSAPGVSIYSTWLGTGYATKSGTSMATPHVAGAAALLLQAHPEWTPQQVKSALVEGAGVMDESVWMAGSGQLWVPDADYIDIFASQAPISYKIPNGTAMLVNFTNSGASVNLTVTTEDWNSLAYNGSEAPLVWSNLSFVSDPFLNISSNSTSSELFNVTIPGAELPEGYYDGVMYLVNATHNIRLAFGFVALSRLDVHVLAVDGDEVFDLHGGVWAFSLPDAEVIVAEAQGVDTSPPATFIIPSGVYAVFSLGHQYIYSSTDPFILSVNITLDRFETRDIYLNMTEARWMILNLSTPDDHPIFVKDFTMYVRYWGEVNMSFAVTGVEPLVTSDNFFTLPKSRTVYISETDPNATIGISAGGFSYSEGMWDFMILNKQHWYQVRPYSFTKFSIEPTADLRYLMAWEFEGVNESTPLNMDVDEASASVYLSKYDIPGWIPTTWVGGPMLTFGEECGIYSKKDTFTAIVPIFSGMTRKTVVQGAFYQMYWPRGTDYVCFDRDFYTPDYSHVISVDGLPGVYVPDQRFLTAPESGVYTDRVSSGPFFASAQTLNTNSSFVLIYPLLKDQSGARADLVGLPKLQVRNSGTLVGSYYLEEHAIQPEPERVIALSGGGGTYMVNITAKGSNEVCTSTETRFGFTVPSIDRNPPRITGLSMSQRFSPGDFIPISFEAVDGISNVTAHLNWRKTGGSWVNVPLTESPAGNFSGSIATDGTTYAVDLQFNLTDATGNYLEYTAVNCALQKIPMTFELAPLDNEVKYNSTTQTVTLRGQLTNSTGGPLDPEGCVPLELILDDIKIGMILDEYVTIGAHSHNGTINFPWDVNATQIFTGPNQSVEVSVPFDFGIYENKTVTFLLNSTFDSGFDAPTITTTPPSTATEDSEYYYDANADQSIDTWALTGNCTGFLSVESSTGIVSGTPNNSFANEWFDANLSATNGAGVAWQNFTVSVWNTPPTITPPPTTGAVSHAYNFNIEHSDEGVGTPPGNFTGITTNCTDSYSFTESNGWLNWTPTIKGTVWWNVTANDQVGVANSTAYLNWTVTVSDEAPLIFGSPSTSITVYYPYWFNATCTLADSGANYWGLETNATWLSVSWSNQTLCNVTGTPTSAGTYWANLSVWDADSDDYVNWSITVNAFAPDITSSAVTSSSEDKYYSYQATANQTVTWGLSTDADFLSISGGLVSGTPNNTHANKNFYVNVSCSNPNGTDYQNFTLSCANLQPVITSSPVIAVVNNTDYSYNLNHTDEGIGGGNFSLVSTNYSESCTFDHTNGWLNFTATVVGIFWFNVTADDQSGSANATFYQNWSVTISESTPLIINSPILIVVVWTFYWFDCLCTPADVGVNVWVFVTNASWLSSGATSETHYNVSGTPHVIGIYWVNLSVSDDDSGEFINWSVEVQAGPAPSIISYPILGVIEDSLYFYLPFADQTVTWSLLWLDGTWLTFNPNGSLIGTPNNTVSEYGFLVWIEASNMNGTDEQSWDVIVYNNPPSFSANPFTEVYFEKTYYYNVSFDDWSEGGVIVGITTNYTGAYSFDVGTGKLQLSGSTVGPFWFAIEIDDQSGATNGTQVQNWTLNICYSIVFTTSPDLGALEDYEYLYHPVANTTCSWDVQTNASWLSWNPATLDLRGSMDNAYSERFYWVNITVTNPNGRNWINYTIFVANGPPTYITSPATTAIQNILYVYDASASDELQGIPIPIYSYATNFTGWLYLNLTTGVMAFTPLTCSYYWFNLSFDDERGAGNSTTFQNFTILIIPYGFVPPVEFNPLNPGAVWVSFKYVVDGLSVAFSDNSYGSAKSYIWDFGDGKGSTAQNPTHLYLSRGIFNVTLTVIGADNKTYVVTTRINVGQDLPWEPTDEGWKVRLTDELIIDVSATGLLVSGFLLWVSVSLFKDAPIITRKGRMVIGSLMIIASTYYFIFVNNRWMG